MLRLRRRLMAVVRPEFRADVLVADTTNPMFGPDPARWPDRLIPLVDEGPGSSAYTVASGLIVAVRRYETRYAGPPATPVLLEG